MFCNKCGSLIQDGSSFCPVCGNAISAQPEQQAQPTQQIVSQVPASTTPNTLATTGMILGIVSASLAVICWIIFWWLGLVAMMTGTAGIVLSSLGMSRANKLNGTGKNNSIAGLVTSIVGTVLGFIAVIVMFAWFF